MEPAIKTEPQSAKESQQELVPAPGTLSFICNVCGAANSLDAASIQREAGACGRCGANVRFRSMAAVLTQRLFGTTAVLAQLEPNQSISGIGMSDAACYATQLQAKFNYTNTFFHCEPHLDISQPNVSWIGQNDFVISSDVFEHVAPPVQQAFNNLHDLLRPGGVAVFSVPFSLESDTTEHFPNLYRFTITEDPEGTWVLKNETAAGELEQFRNLVFHGGPGSTLEMRLFSLSALKRHFDAAGFVDFRVHREAVFEHGIFWLDPWSITISALRAHG